MAVVQGKNLLLNSGGFGEMHTGKPFHATIRRPLGLRAMLAANIQQQGKVQKQKVTKSSAIPIPRQPEARQRASHKAQEEITAAAMETKVFEEESSTEEDQLADALQAHDSPPPQSPCPAENEDMDTDNNGIKMMETMDKHSPSFCLEYTKDIYEYLRFLEVKHQLGKDYMSIQHFIHPHMRTTVVDWMVCVQVKFGLLQDTLLLSVALLDHFLAVHPILKEELQLVGVTALLMASKYEEVYALQVGDMVYVTDNLYTTSNIHAMETLMMKMLDYFLGYPTVMSFLRWYSNIAQLSVLMYAMAKFLTELATTHYSVHSYRPSLLAAAAICLSTKLIHEDSCKWSANLEHFIGYSESDLTQCMCWLSRQVLAMPSAKHKAVMEKYSDVSLMGVARMASLWGPTIRAMSRQWKQTN